MSRLSLRRSVSCWLMLAMGASAALAAAPHEKETAAATKVRAALRAEIAAQTAQRSELLAAARLEAPQFAAAHWHSGYLRSGKAWATVEEVQRQGAADKRLDEYSLQRATVGETAEGQLALAMWCRAKGLVDQERLHLTKVLQFDPKNAEAAKRLGVRWLNGQWLTAAEVAAQQEADRAAARDWHKWSPVVRSWRDAVEGDDADRRAKALGELRAVSDPAAVPALERLLASRSQVLALEVVDVLAIIADQRATESLIRSAVLPQWQSVREAAAEQLKSRDRYSYLPQLLSGLAMPIQLDVVATPDTTIVSFFQETQDARYHVVRGQTINTLHVLRTFYPNRPGTPLATTGVDTDSSRAASRSQQAANQLRARAAETNQAIARQNARICEALSRVTDRAYSTDPPVWWDWWATANETYAVEKPEHSWRYYDMVHDCCVKYAVNPSCFVAGTPVWTERGLTPIEQIQTGDRVLAQDPDSGELRFQCVLQTTLRPESPLVKIRCGSDTSRTGETILATRGHPFWVSGHGWRMAKELRPGDLLHGVRGSVRAEAVEEEQPQRAYNLMVDGFNTYFVGQTGLLVHDNVLRKPTPYVLPGLKKSEMATTE